MPRGRLQGNHDPQRNLCDTHDPQPILCDIEYTFVSHKRGSATPPPHNDRGPGGCRGRGLRGGGGAMGPARVRKREMAYKNSGLEAYRQSRRKPMIMMTVMKITMYQ